MICADNMAGDPQAATDRVLKRPMPDRNLPRSSARAILFAAAALLLADGAAVAQPTPGSPPAQPTPGSTAASPLSPALTTPVEPVRTPSTVGRNGPSDADLASLKTAVDAARRADVNGARVAITAISDPIAKKIAVWALVDANSTSLSYFELDQARRDLAGWARGARRQTATERLLDGSNQSPAQIVAWFAGADPVTAEGALALAVAFRSTNQPKQASDLVRLFWRERVFDVETQQAMLAKFPDVLNAEDHTRRVDLLLLAGRTSAARELIPLIPSEQRQLAQARIAVKADSAGASALVAALPPSVSDSPGLAFERAAALRRRDQEEAAYPFLKFFPNDLSAPEVAARVWPERRQLIKAALAARDPVNAYAAAADSGLKSGGDAAEAEFYAGWIALTRLHDPAKADKHFSALERIGSSPITRGRALYWRGRAADGLKAPEVSEVFYRAAAKYPTTFYGQLALERLGSIKLDLGADPQITQADRERFTGRPQVRAARILIEAGYPDLFRVFALSLAETLPSAEEEALLVDLARGYGEQDASMKVVRAAAQRGYILPVRGYPVRTPPEAPNAAEAPLVLGITRQESGFDPKVRSGVGARGMMQLMPKTASIVARRTGVPYAAAKLDDPDYNMRLGSSYLGDLVSGFSGSYVMGIAGYNAGPGRPAKWVDFCGDPRGAGADPIDFIECIPFTETRNYVMRVLEATQVYRARLNGGQAPIALSYDLKRGRYGAAAPQELVPSSASGSPGR